MKQRLNFKQRPLVEKYLIQTSKFLKHNWRTVLLFFIPIAFSPLMISGKKSMQCGYVIIIVASYWVTEIMNLAIASLIPVVLFPIFQILTPEGVASCYMKDITLMLIGGLIVAKTIEKQNLHKRMALHILKFMGPNPIFQYLGFMLSTWFLSMWISNSSTTAMMITLADAVTIQWMYLAETRFQENRQAADKQLMDETRWEESRRLSDEQLQNENILQENRQPTDESIPRTILVSSYETDEQPDDEIEKVKTISKGLLLSIAYSATCGGIATIPGTPPNLVFYGFMETRYGSKLGLNFGSFMLFSFPISLILIFFCWFLLIIRYIGVKEVFRRKLDVDVDQKVMNSINNEFDNLGPITYGEIETLIVFFVLVTLWILREPGIPIWGKLFIYKINGKPIKFWTDGISAIIAAFFVFNLPEKNPFKISINERNEKLINWNYVEREFSWGIVFLFGGGFALAAGCEASGLSGIIGDMLTSLKNLSHYTLILLISLGISFLTEVTSNAVTTTIMLPIMIKMAECIKMHPMTMGLAVTLSSSFSFCLPAATPPNAIIVSTGKVHVIDMVTSGLVLNIFCVLVMSIMAYYYSILIFGTNAFPDWILGNCTI